MEISNRRIQMPEPLKGDNDLSGLPVLTLAYIGDAVFELWVRSFLIEQGLARADVLHKAAVCVVQAKGQAELMRALLPDLDEDERGVYYRGRNAKSQYPRQGDVIDYRQATGLEALIGHLYLSGQQERLEVLLDKIGGLITV
ncbi:MAG: Mini-ribonuclease 3 [Peptococcaceae bacterium]|nr:Mini-ribonuclease 3 [Peptococcaceae bacterium]